MWIDVHAHLYSYSDEELSAILAAARGAGVERIVNTAADHGSLQQVIRQHQRHPDVLLPTAGYSPFEADSLPDGWERPLADALDRSEVVACGEAGLDVSNPSYPPLSSQLPLLRRQLILAVQRDKPVVLHSRGAEADVLRECARAGVRKALFHCFSGDATTLSAVLNAGYYVSFSGIVTFRNRPLDGQVAATPLDRIFVESDTPYLAPAPHRGKPNQPAWVCHTAERVAAVKGVEPQTLAEAVRGNFARLFGK